MDTGTLMSALCKPKLLIHVLSLLISETQWPKPVATDRLLFTYGVGRKEEILGLGYRVV